MVFRRIIAYVIPYFWDFCERQEKNRTNDRNEKATHRWFGMRRFRSYVSTSIVEQRSVMPGE
ncbi:hypothetical protein EVA_15153 [gut metagenome]|uniref:Uncharacterized protein n=1 Tax=gut metagenome TaxID=749906 RepID=J9FP79_9ZZZZ